jgi:hypothetical protein
MKYRIVKWNYNKKALHLDKVEYETKYKRRIGDNSWLQLLNDSEELHLTSDTSYDDIISAEIRFNEKLAVYSIATWDKVWKQKLGKWFNNYSWEDKLEKEFDNSFCITIKELLSDVYELALEDSQCVKKYTHLVLHNLQLIADNGIESISFRQWKSFRAYKHTNLKKETKDIKHKLGL